MALSEEAKQKIKEEEQYRSQVKDEEKTKVEKQKNKKSNQRALGCLAIIIIAVIAVIAIAAISGGNDDTKKSDTTTQQQAQNFATQEVTENTVRSAIANLDDAGYKVHLKGNITKVEVLDNLGTEDVTDDKIVHVYYKPEVWDEKDAMETAAGTAVGAMEVLFKNPKVGSVVMWQQGDFTDAYGKSSTDTAVRISLEKSEADKIEWEGLKTRVLLNYEDLFNVATLEYRHPAISKEL